MTASDVVFPGGVIGEIEIVGVLGTGGMGRVYSGYDRRLERRVALKVIRSERSLDQEARRRFVREARMLSRIQHPNICQIHDLIERPEGDVLILEQVEGRSLREVIEGGIDQNDALAIGRQLLEVLVAVHREGIVHRDLKPENIMVQPDGSIKVLDFGLARGIEKAVPPAPGGPSDIGVLEDQDVTAEWISARSENLTSQHFLVGTLRYMSPEQARGEQVGSASDLFSAGLILHEMLTGESPFDQDLPIEVLLKKVAWGDIRPATGVAPALRGFLERLTSMAPADRPSSRDAFEQLGIILHAPRRRRLRLLLSAGVCLMTLLAAGMTVQWIRASREADRARRSLAEAREVSVFLEQLFELSNPFALREEQQPERGESITAEALLERGAETIRERFEDQPLARARFMIVLGSIHWKLGRFDRAAEMLEQALAIRRELLSPEDPQLGLVLLKLGAVRRTQAKFTEAGELLDEALRISSSGAPGRLMEHANVLEEMALLASEQAKFQEAENLFETVLEIRRSMPVTQDIALALTLQRSAGVQLALGHRSPARSLLGEALDIVRKNRGSGGLAEVSMLSELARIDIASGRLIDAEDHLMGALSTARARLPAEHPLLATLLTNLANVLDDQGRFEEAEPLQREALSIKEKAVGTDHPEYAQILFNLGRLTENQGRFDEAESLYGQALEVFEESLGSEHPLVGVGLNSLAILKQEKGDFLGAEVLYLRALDVFQKAFGREHPYTTMVLNNLGEVNRLNGRLEIAEGFYQEALEVGEKTNGADHPATAEVLRGLAITSGALGKTEQAEDYFQRALDILEAAGVATDQVLSDQEDWRAGLNTRPK